MLAWQVGIRQVFIGLQENKRSCECCACVAVIEGVITAEVEKVGRTDIDDVIDERFPGIGGLRGRHSGFEQRAIPQSRHTSVCGQHFGVDRFNRLYGEEPEIRFRQGV